MLESLIKKKSLKKRKMKKCENCKENEVSENERDVCDDCINKVLKKGK